MREKFRGRSELAYPEMGLKGDVSALTPQAFNSPAFNSPAFNPPAFKSPAFKSPVFDSGALNPGAFTPPALASRAGRPSLFRAGKRALDILSAIAGLCLAALAAVVLLVLNPLFNPGPLLFRQQRMGRWGRPFTMWKFRSMTAAPEGARRAPTSPLETDRITPLGHFIRRSRIDELPNFWSVLKGEMALVGPRPDVWDHAAWFSEHVPYYKYRVRVRPGITGLAQIRGGYADEVITIHRKARYDYHYIRNGSPMMDAYIILRTVSVMLFGTGAK